MANVGLMQILQPTQNIIHNAFTLNFLQILVGLQKFLHVHVSLFEDQVGVLVVGRVLYGEHGHKLVLTLVLHLFKNGQLS